MQFSLFDPEPLPNGAIVRQAKPWIGLCYWPPHVPERKHVIYPYWQIRYAAHPGYEILEQTPTCTSYGKHYEELPGAPLQYYCVAVPYGVYLCDVWWFKPEDIVDTGLRWRVPSWDELKGADPGRYGRQMGNDYGAPYAMEAELVTMLDTLPVPWRYGEVTTDNFYQWFGAPKPESLLVTA